MILRSRVLPPGPPQRAVWLLGALAAWLALGACAPSSANLTKLLVDAQEDFQDGVRWQKHEVVAEHLRGETKEAFLKAAEAADGSLRVSEIELIRSVFSDAGRKAVLRFRYHWFRTSEISVQKSVVVLHWRFEGKTWRVEKIEPGAGPDFPLFTAPPPPARPRARPAGEPPPGRRP